ncbi:MAG: N-acetyltransferase family protein [Flavobacteriaceae bacterium]
MADLAPLFDAYRVFYGQKPNIKAAVDFLIERFKNKDNVVFIAYHKGKAVGFTQLYTTYSSVSMQAFYILNDLYVDMEYRNKGIGEALLGRAQEQCTRMDYKGLALETAVDNPAQKLYERLGWKKDSHCFHYFWSAT